jgi:hypothetical protein
MNIMNAVSQNYTPALVISPAEISAGVESFFNGEDLLAKMQAIPLSTVDADGWSRVSLLSVGEIVFRPGEGFRFCVFQQSHTAANLMRDGRATLSTALDGGIWELRLRATACDRDVAEGSLAFFKAKIDSARLHAAPYAEVTSGVTFSLHEPSAVLPRWQKQIATARALS